MRAAVQFGRERSAAPATSGLWNAQATGIRRPDTPRAASGSSRGLDRCRGPGDHGLIRGVVVGQDHAGLAVAAPCRRSDLFDGRALTAAIAPGSSPAAARMACARASLSSSRSSWFDGTGGSKREEFAVAVPGEPWPGGRRAR